MLLANPIGILILSLTGSITFATVITSNYCFVRDPIRQQLKKFTTKTAYQYARGRDPENFQVPGCEPKRFWLFARHGTRLPSGNSMDELKELENLKNEILANNSHSLCAEDTKLLKSWRWHSNLTEDFDNFLTRQGWEDLKTLGEAYKRRFPEIFDGRYSKERFKFDHTETQRSEASCRAFARGLFGNVTLNKVMKDVENFLSLIRPYDDCENWKKKASKTESKSFKNSIHYQKVSQEISMRLGFEEALDPDIIENIWDMCRYDQAWHIDRLSPWCVAITPNQLHVLEYAEDLNYYYKAGYGSEMNSNMMCSAMRDMLAFIQRNDARNVFAYHSHASAIQLLLVALGFAKDSNPLTADNFDQMMERKWKMSEWSAFASNLAVVTYICPTESDPRKVQFFWNEKLIRDLDFCDNGLCNIEQVLSKYERFLNASCDSVTCSGSMK